MLIKVENLKKTYEGEMDFQALKGISLEIEKGDFVSIVGRSGSGKSTLLNCIAGLDIPQEGNVVIDGMSIYGLSENQRAVYRREYIGLIFQQYHLIPVLTSLENVMMASAFSKSKSLEQDAGELLKRVGLQGKESNIPSKLSGGESQRVAIARAMANEPIIILADEPTGNLDHETGEKIMGLLASLNREGHTIIMVTHDIEWAKYGNKIVTLDDGKLISIKKGGNYGRREKAKSARGRKGKK